MGTARPSGGVDKVRVETGSRQPYLYLLIDHSRSTDFHQIPQTFTQGIGFGKRIEKLSDCLLFFLPECVGFFCVTLSMMQFLRGAVYAPGSKGRFRIFHNVDCLDNLRVSFIQGVFLDGNLGKQPVTEREISILRRAGRKIMQPLGVMPRFSEFAQQ